MNRLILAAALVSLAACGGRSPGGSGSSNTPTSPSTPQVNRSPVINSMTISPSFGVLNLATFDYGAAASDPDGDAVIYSWNIAGRTFSSASGQFVPATGGATTATLTVSDGKGGTTSDSRTVVVGTMAGTWRGSLVGIPITMVLEQPTAGVITGTWNFPGTPYSGKLDPAAANRIDGAGAMTMRLKVSTGGGPRGFDDFTLTGNMDSTGIRITGAANGSGFFSDPFTLNK